MYGQIGSGDVGIYLRRCRGRRRTWSSAITGGLRRRYSCTVTNNRVYNNAEIGIYAAYSSNVCGQHGLFQLGGDPLGPVTTATVRIANNLVYANSNQGILVVTTTGGSNNAILNNTVYQPVGDAIKLQNAPNVRLRNNILWVNAGYDLNIDSASQVGFDSDYNLLHHGLDPECACGSLGNDDWRRAGRLAGTVPAGCPIGGR